MRQNPVHLFALSLGTLTLAACSDFNLQQLKTGEAEPDYTLDPVAGEQQDEEWTAEEDEEMGGGDEGSFGTDDEPEEETPDEEEEETPEEEPAPEDDCEDTSELIYVVERDNDTLMLFDPQTVSFTALGALECDYWSRPASMGIARDGVGLVRYADDSVYEVDLETLACTPVDYSRPGDFDSFGMGFATERAGTWRDHLFVADRDTLARFDRNTHEITPVGTMPSQSELTGNAAGELWAFLPLEHPAALVELDQTNGRELQYLSLPGFPDASNLDAFAFAAWDGEFWLFVRTYGMGNSTDVYRVTASGELILERERVGFDVVGAGVSTCAPE